MGEGILMTQYELYKELSRILSFPDEEQVKEFYKWILQLFINIEEK